MTGGHKLVCLAMAVPAIPAQSQRAIVRPPGPVVTFRLRRRVASAEPGLMDTPFQERTEAIFCQLEGRSELEAYKAERTARIPLGRRSGPEKMAAMVVGLATERPTT
jgi:hypothetical protein